MILAREEGDKSHGRTHGCFRDGSGIEGPVILDDVEWWKGDALVGKNGASRLRVRYDGLDLFDLVNSILHWTLGFGVLIRFDILVVANSVTVLEEMPSRMLFVSTIDGERLRALSLNFGKCPLHLGILPKYVTRLARPTDCVFQLTLKHDQ